MPPRRKYLGRARRVAGDIRELEDMFRARGLRGGSVSGRSFRHIQLGSVAGEPVNQAGVHLEKPSYGG